MDLQQRFNQIINRHDWWQTGQPVVVAVSTGVDSMTLLELLQHLPKKRPQIIVAYVDHQLRDQSRLETAFIQRYCRDHHLQLAQTVWKRTSHPSHGIEAAAREFRYRFFRSVLKANRATVLLTAHHSDDLAETMLMKLVRGGQIESLIGIQQQRQTAFGRLIRPMLAFSKRDIRRFAASKQLHWFEDQTNQDLTIERNRFRYRYLADLKRENARILTHFGDYSKQLEMLTAANRELITPIAEQLVVSFTANREIVLNGTRLTAYSKPVQMAVLKYLIEVKLDICNVALPQFEQLLRLLANPAKPQGQLQLSNNWQFIKSYQRLSIVKKVDKPVTKPKISRQFMVILDRWYLLDGGLKFGVFTTRPSEADKVTVFHLTDSQLPLSIRQWQPGDRLRLKNGGHQKISRVMIDLKVPKGQRLNANLLVTSQDKILAVIGLKSAALPGDSGQRLYLAESGSQLTSERKGTNNE